MARRDKVVRTRVTSAERELLMRRAKKLNMTLSDYLRFASIESEALQVVTIDTTPLVKLEYELTKQGVNLNQFMKFLNTYGVDAYNANEAGRILAKEGEAFLKVIDALSDLEHEAERHHIRILDSKEGKKKDPDE